MSKNMNLKTFVNQLSSYISMIGTTLTIISAVVWSTYFVSSLDKRLAIVETSNEMMHQDMVDMKSSIGRVEVFIRELAITSMRRDDKIEYKKSYSDREDLYEMDMDKRPKKANAR